MPRTSDTDKTAIYFQTGRFIQQNSEWFYATRENVERGPFLSKKEASDDLEAYIYRLHIMESFENKS